MNNVEVGGSRLEYQVNMDTAMNPLESKLDAIDANYPTANERNKQRLERRGFFTGLQELVE